MAGKQVPHNLKTTSQFRCLHLFYMLVSFINQLKTALRFRCLYLLYVLVSFINQLKPHSSFVVYRAVLACNANAVMGTSDSKATPSVLRFLSITIAYGCMDFTFRMTLVCNMAHFTMQSHPFYRAIPAILHAKMADIETQDASR